MEQRSTREGWSNVRHEGALLLFSPSSLSYSRSLDASLYLYILPPVYLILAPSRSVSLNVALHFSVALDKSSRVRVSLYLVRIIFHSRKFELDSGRFIY